MRELPHSWGETKPLYSARRWITQLRSRRGLARLEGERGGQRERFDRLAPRFGEVHASIQSLVDPESTTEAWREFNAHVEAALLPVPPFDFLQNPTISRTMHVSVGGEWLAAQRRFVEEKLPRDRLLEVVKEDPVGAPDILVPEWSSSHNTVHHLYHLLRWEAETGRRLADARTVVEWGGGYGNLAKVLGRVHPGGRTYVIVDTPIFSALQWLYLSTVLGEEHVHLLRSPNDTILPGRVNLVPGGLLDGLDVKADLFVSTWALSESSAAAQRRVIERDWFGAPGLLLGYQAKDPVFPDAPRVGREVEKGGGRVFPIPFIPENCYAFR